MFLTAIEAYRERYMGTIQLLSNLRVGPFLKWELKAWSEVHTGSDYIRESRTFSWHQGIMTCGDAKWAGHESKSQLWGARRSLLQNKKCGRRIKDFKHSKQHVRLLCSLTSLASTKFNKFRQLVKTSEPIRSQRCLQQLLFQIKQTAMKVLSSYPKEDYSKIWSIYS